MVFIHKAASFCTQTFPTRAEPGWWIPSSTKHSFQISFSAPSILASNYSLFSWSLSHMISLAFWGKLHFPKDSQHIRYPLQCNAETLPVVTPSLGSVYFLICSLFFGWLLRAYYLSKSRLSSMRMVKELNSLFLFFFFWPHLLGDRSFF